MAEAEYHHAAARIEHIAHTLAGPDLYAILAHIARHNPPSVAGLDSAATRRLAVELLPAAANVQWNAQR